MPRRRIGDGPSPSLLGQIVLALIGDATNRVRDARAAGMTAADLAQVLGTQPAQARVAAGELVRARCLQVGRAPTARHGDSGRYAQAFRLPPAGQERGKSRSPRLFPVGLIVAADRAVATELGASLRQVGVLPVAVGTVDAAFLLLHHLGFELVILDTSASPTLPAADAARFRDAMREASCGPTLVLTDAAQDAALMELAAGVGATTVMSRPFGVTSLREACGQVLGGNGMSAGSPMPPAMPAKPQGDVLSSSNLF